MALKLRVPRIADEPDPAVEVRPVYVEEWIEALPTANPPALVRALREALHRLNRSPVKAPARLALLELYLRPYEYLIDLQEKHDPVHDIAALERQRADTDSARRVASEMATGYKIVLAHSVGKTGLFGGNKEMRVATQRATVFISLTLLHTFDQYLPAPPELWEELHSLHMYAMQNDLAAATIPSPSRREDLAVSVANAYRRILLTSLVDPYHLGYGDVWRVYRALAGCADAARIEPYRADAKPGGLFVLDPEREHRPLPYAQARDHAAGDAWILDVNPVLSLLRSRESEGRGKEDAGGSRLLSRMVRALTLPPKRHAPREPSKGRVGLATGLSAVHHLLGGEPAEAASAEDPDADGLTSLADETPVVSYTAEFWDLVNRGPSGIGVIRHIRPRSAIGVGDVIGLQIPLEGQSGKNWMIGLVRWLNIADGGEYQAGVQIVSKGAQAVSLVLGSGDERSRARPRRAIAAPEVGPAKGATLIAPTGTFAPSVMIRVRVDGRDRRIVADALLESTGIVDRFTYRMETGGA